MSITQQTTQARRGWACSVLAATVFWIALGVFGVARTGYSQFTKAVSELGAVGAPHALAWNVLGFIVPGLLLATGGVAIATVVDGRRGTLRWLLAGSGVAFAATGVFPAVMHDGSPLMRAPSTVGHVVMLLLSSLLWLVAIGVLLRKVAREPRRRRMLTPFVIVTVVALADLPRTCSTTPSRRWRTAQGWRSGSDSRGTFCGSCRCPLWTARSTTAKPNSA